MPKLIKNREIVDDNTLVLRHTADGELPALPAQGDVLVPLAMWQTRQDLLAAHPGKVGVWLAPDEDPAALAGDLARLPLIAVDFPSFVDGRGYSIARLLRQRYGYQGELRAIGDILKDQMFYLARCGFNAYAVRADRSIEDALKGLDDFSEAYQVSVVQPEPLFRRRA